METWFLKFHDMRMCENAVLQMKEIFSFSFKFLPPQPPNILLNLRLKLIVLLQ